jgi:hypothetical protein
MTAFNRCLAISTQTAADQSGIGTYVSIELPPEEYYQGYAQNNIRVTSNMKSNWQTLKAQSTYHFDPTEQDQPESVMTYLGHIEPPGLTI